MFSKLLLTAMAGAVLLQTLYALPDPQSSAPQSGMGSDDTGAPRIGTQRRTPYEQFGDRLKLDAKTQAPAVEAIFAGAQKEAAPVGVQMLQLRQRLVNLVLENKAEETKPVVEAYTAAAAKMTAIEARAFAKVYALLKPNQQSNASQAFAIIAGIFQQAAPPGGARGGQRGGGRP